MSSREAQLWVCVDCLYFGNCEAAELVERRLHFGRQKTRARSTSKLDSQASGSVVRAQSKPNPPRGVEMWAAHYRFAFHGTRFHSTSRPSQMEQATRGN